MLSAGIGFAAAAGDCSNAPSSTIAIFVGKQIASVVPSARSDNGSDDAQGTIGKIIASVVCSARVLNGIDVPFIVGEMRASVFSSARSDNGSDVPSITGESLASAVASA